MNNMLRHYLYRIAICLMTVIVGISGVGSLIVKSSEAEDYYTYLPIISKPFPSPCTSYSALLTTIPPTTTIQANEPFTITTYLQNKGCIYLGLPSYHLYLYSDTQTFLRSLGNEMHYLSVPVGGSDLAEFPVTITHTGQLSLRSYSNFEVHYASGPPINGRAEAQWVAIEVLP
jgi:hypothetical protein